MVITRGDSFHGRQQRCARADETLWGKDQALERRLHVSSSQRPAIVKLHAFAKEKCVGFPVFSNLPTVGEVGDDSLPTVPRVTPDQVIIHTALCENGGTLLMYVEVRRRIDDPVT